MYSLCVCCKYTSDFRISLIASSFVQIWPCSRVTTQPSISHSINEALKTRLLRTFERRVSQLRSYHRDNLPSTNTGGPNAGNWGHDLSGRELEKKPASPLETLCPCCRSRLEPRSVPVLPQNSQNATTELQTPNSTRDWTHADDTRGKMEEDGLTLRRRDSQPCADVASTPSCLSSSIVWRDMPKFAFARNSCCVQAYWR